MPIYFTLAVWMLVASFVMMVISLMVFLEGRRRYLEWQRCSDAIGGMLTGVISMHRISTDIIVSAIEEHRQDSTSHTLH